MTRVSRRSKGASWVSDRERNLPKGRSIGASTLIVCLYDAISRHNVKPLAAGIADWRDALSLAGEPTVVFLDSAFDDDVAIMNLAETLKQRGLGNVRSL